MGLYVRIVAPGICGPVLASLLLRSLEGHNITIVERSPQMRIAGAQIDLKSQGMPFARRMDLLDAVQRHAVRETGLEFGNPKDTSPVTLGVSTSGKRMFTLTSEYEIMHGDLVRVLYGDSIKQASQDARSESLHGQFLYEFNPMVADLFQDDKRVHVKFSTDETHDFDFVVGADGLRSRTRSLAFGSQVDDVAFKLLGI